MSSEQAGERIRTLVARIGADESAAEQESALEAMQSLIVIPANARIFRDAGALPLLLHLIKSGTMASHWAALTSGGLVSWAPEDLGLHTEMLNLGFIPALMTLADEREDLVWSALVGLKHLASRSAACQDACRQEGILELLQECLDMDVDWRLAEKALECVHHFARMHATNQAAVLELMPPLLPTIVEFLGDTDSCKLAAAIAMNGLMQSATQDRQRVMATALLAAGAAPGLIALLHPTRGDELHKAALVNIIQISRGRQGRSACSDAIPGIARLARNRGNKFLRLHALWAMDRLCWEFDLCGRHHALNQRALQEAGCLKLAVGLLRCKDVEVKAAALTALAGMTFKANSVPMLQAGGIPQVMEVLRWSTPLPEHAMMCGHAAIVLHNLVQYGKRSVVRKVLAAGAQAALWRVVETSEREGALQHAATGLAAIAAALDNPARVALWSEVVQLTTRRSGAGLMGAVHLYLVAPELREHLVEDAALCLRAVSGLLRGLRVGSRLVKSEAALDLHFLMKDVGEPVCLEVMRAGGIELLVEQLSAGFLAAGHNAAYAIWSLARLGHTAAIMEEEECIPRLVGLMFVAGKEDAEDVQEQAWTALREMGNGSEEARLATERALATELRKIRADSEAEGDEPIAEILGRRFHI